jgi:ribose transport system permease protein
LRRFGRWLLGNLLSSATRVEATAVADAVDEAPKGQPLPAVGLRRLMRLHMPTVLLLILTIVASFLSDVFLTVNNLNNILWAVSVLGIVALGQATLLLTGNFDMSVAYVVGFSGIVTVLAQGAGLGLVASMVLGLASGALIGLVNAVITVTTRANPFLVTLGTGLFVYATSLTLTKSSTLYASIPAFNVLGRGQLFDTVYYSVLLFLGLAVLIELFLRTTKFGRWVYVLGADEEAGHLAGLPMRRIKFLAFVFCGTMAALASLVMVSRTNSTVANAGVGMEFDSIMAAVLGGTSLFGGEGGALRTVVGVLVIGVLNNLLVLLGMPFEGQQIAKGAVFLLVVWSHGVLRQS